MAKSVGLLIVLVLSLSSLLIGGCRPQYSGVPCHVDGQTLWLQPNGKFAQAYSYTANFLNPADPNAPVVSDTNIGFWQLVLPGGGSPDGRAYVLVQNMIIGGIGANSGLPGGSPGTEQSKLVPVSDIPNLKKVLSPSQMLELSTAQARPPVLLPKPPPIVIKVGPPK